jgi:Subtilase family
MSRARSMVASSRLGRIGAAVVLVTAMTAGAVTTAMAGTHARPPAGPQRTMLAAPGSQTLPGALTVAQPHGGAGQMSHPLMVRAQGWTHQSADCALMTKGVADTISAPANPDRCATPQLTAKAPAGYSPAQFRALLGLHGTGAGERVAIVDAYDNPYAQRDVTKFSEQFGLPLPCGTAGTAGTAGTVRKSGQSGCFTFTRVHPYGFDGVDAGWALESDLDVEMVHAIAPQASIILVEAHDSSLISMLQAVKYAGSLSPAPSAISNSWGTPEFSAESQVSSVCALAKTLCVAAAGDDGNPGWFPAYDPYVLAVGGTTLGMSADGKASLEDAWCCTDPLDSAATGGGVSKYQVRPAYQNGLNPYLGRSIPDVSFDADPYTGVPVYNTMGIDDQNGWFEVGGTSVGSPAWAGIVAAADQLRAAAGRPPLAGAHFQALTLLYSQARHHAAGFADITIGADNMNECTSPVRSCQAHPGFDEVSGWGSPRPGIDETLASP